MLARMVPFVAAAGLVALLLFQPLRPPLVIAVASSPSTPPAAASEAAPPVSVSLREITRSTPLAMSGDCGWNVQVALDASGGALRRVELAPGATFSFNATLGNPGVVDYRACAGVPGGAWCDLAARYAQAARAVGLLPVFEHHGIQLAGVAWEDSVAIWNTDGRAGSQGEGQDLEIANTTNAPLLFVVLDTPDGWVVTVQQG